MKLTERQIDILVYFAINSFATRNDYIRSEANISEGGTKSNIKRLLSLGVLRCVERSGDPDVAYRGVVGSSLGDLD